MVPKRAGGPCSKCKAGRLNEDLECMACEVEPNATALGLDDEIAVEVEPEPDNDPLD